jgi:hypothetical protein
MAHVCTHTSARYYDPPNFPSRMEKGEVDGGAPRIERSDGKLKARSLCSQESDMRAGRDPDPRSRTRGSEILAPSDLHVLRGRALAPTTHPLREDRRQAIDLSPQEDRKSNGRRGLDRIIPIAKHVHCRIQRAQRCLCQTNEMSSKSTSIVEGGRSPEQRAC